MSHTSETSNRSPIANDAPMKNASDSSVVIRLEKCVDGNDFVVVSVDSVVCSTLRLRLR